MEWRNNAHIANTLIGITSCSRMASFTYAPLRHLVRFLIECFETLNPWSLPRPRSTELRDLRRDRVFPPTGASDGLRNALE
jgi:hypothetical protein